MKRSRRQLLHLAAGATALPVVSRFAWAQSYPTRPVQMIVGFPPGGVGDILTRLVGQWLSEHLGQPFIVENRPGAAGNIAAESVARAPADGHTLLLIGGSNAISGTLYDKPNFNFIRDITAVAGIMRAPLVMDVNPLVPARSVPEFIAYAKAHPGKLSMASAGTASTSHVAGELFKMMTGINMPHVPYRGDAPAITDLMSGQVQVCFVNATASIPPIRAGKLRALAVTTATRAEALPDIPTVGEFVPGYEVSLWIGIGAPKNTPAEIVDKLNRKINAGLADTRIKARLSELGGVPLLGSPAELETLVADETEKWRKVIRTANIKAE